LAMLFGIKIIQKIWVQVAADLAVTVHLHAILNVVYPTGSESQSRRCK
jgi:hypothetical protein